MGLYAFDLSSTEDILEKSHSPGLDIRYGREDVG